MCLFNNFQTENRLKSHRARREQSGFPAAASLNRLYRQCSGGYLLCAPTVSRPEHWR